MTRLGRAPYLALAVVALTAGLWGGLARVGWNVSPPSTSFVAYHGLFMTLGFLGTVISLERGVALGRRPAYAAPAATGLGALLLAVGLPPQLGMTLITLGGALFVAVSIFMLRMAPELYTGVMGLGALAWVVAGVLFIAGADIAALVPFLAAFLVLTIVGERLELARLLRLSNIGRSLFVAATIVFITGVVSSLVVPDVGVRVAGAGAFALGLWLLRYDIARRTVRQHGSVRYIATCVLLGYAWLALGGILWLAIGPQVAGFGWDAMLHSIFLGYVMSMVLAHELIVVPAVLRIAMPFTHAFYVPLVLLETSLALRVIGDALQSAAWWQWTGLLNVTAIVLFAAVSVGSARGILRPVQHADR